MSSPALVRGAALNDADKARNRQLVHALKSFLFDTVYGGASSSSSSLLSTVSDGTSTTHPIERTYVRFYALETIARMPYFAYVSVLHLLETLGQWRQAEYLKLHFCQAWNELHHLLILEDLLVVRGGGNNSGGGTSGVGDSAQSQSQPPHSHSHLHWRDRFLAQHAAVAYYWIAVVLYLVNPALAYNLNQAVEEEACDTYGAFLVTHRDYLQSQPAPRVARQYYEGNDLYMFDSMHHEHLAHHHHSFDASVMEGDISSVRRRPTCETLFDTFVNIRDDEMEHVKTMMYLQGE